MAATASPGSPARSTTEVMSAEALLVKLEHPLFHSIALPRPLVPSTWTVQLNDANGLQSGQSQVNDVPLAAAAEALAAALGDAYISIAQDAAGRHRFIRLSDAVSGRASASCIVEEAEVKELQAAKLAAPEGRFKLLYARPVGARNADLPAAGAAGPSTLASLVSDDLAPHSHYTNYSVVPWLCLGTRQRVILCDESTLTRPQPDDRIFESVTLVVNCHEAGCNATKYRIGAGAGQLQVITHAVHEWYGEGSATVEKNDAIQRAIWQHLEAGGSSPGR